MRKVGVVVSAVAAGLIGASPPAVRSGWAATGDGETPQVASARVLGEAADLVLRFIQEDGPESGHVRVVLTPETRRLTVMEARQAAEQAFLEALKEPGLGDGLQRITVVVRMLPRSHPDPSSAEQIIIYQHKSGRDWSVLPGE